MTKKTTDVTAKPDDKKSTEACGLVNGNVRSHALFYKKMFRFTVKIPVHNSGVEPSIFEYSNYSPFQYETKVIYVIANDFDEAIELIKTENTLKRDVTIRHIEAVEKINDRIFIQTNGACVL